MKETAPSRGWPALDCYKTTPPSPAQPPDLVLTQVSFQLQGLLQGLGHHLLSLAQEGLFLRAGPTAQPHSKVPLSGEKEETPKQLSAPPLNGKLGLIAKPRPSPPLACADSEV
jgi:hypothetical protein